MGLTCLGIYVYAINDPLLKTVYMQPLVSSLSAGDCPVHRLRKNQRLHIYSYDVDLLKASKVMLETCRGF
jgi:hypothetical protein